MASMHISLKSGKPGKAAAHANYISRQGPYRKGDKSKDLVATGHGNLPPGFGSMHELWRAADKGERANAAAYREIVGALPRELTSVDHIEVVEKYISLVMPKKPYEWAIHCPRAAIEGGTQPHVHILYTDRIPDGIRRDPAQFFKRYNPSHPDRGGCKKDSGGKDPEAFREEARFKRKTWADVQNEALARYGHEARVDHRSYRSRGLKRETETHLGPAAIRNMTSEEKAAFRQTSAPPPQL